tara:strand:+ start:436 stop:1638 length:1203 start_codon:yes stop_codon:yes gene_type:complete
MNQNIYLLEKAPNIKYKLPNICFNFSETEINSIVLKDEYKNLIFFKNKIDSLQDDKSWDSAKKLSNLYELIYLPNKKYKYDSISNYEPLSRAYFKLFEILVDFNLIDHNYKINIASLAEGPGGFIEASINYRKRITKKKDNIYAITLYSDNKDIPGWNKSKNFLKKNENVVINYGKDGTGDLYKLDNILEYSKLFANEKAELVTADGGFDFSYNFNRQEQLSYRIIFCEIVTALTVQKIGGSFVIKVFDMYTQITQSLIYLLFVCYDKVYITKPNTSRSANSEKYVVCKGFKGINQNYLKKLYIIVDSFNYVKEKNMFINKLFDISFAKEFNFNITNINACFYEKQIKNIKETLKLIDKNNINVEFNNSIKKQTLLAFKWCKYYKVSVNYSSKYLKKYLN